MIRRPLFLSDLLLLAARSATWVPWTTSCIRPCCLLSMIIGMPPAGARLIDSRLGSAQKTAVHLSPEAASPSAPSVLFAGTRMTSDLPMVALLSIAIAFAAASEGPTGRRRSRPVAMMRGGAPLDERCR